jgi:hypothetical protein
MIETLKKTINSTRFWAIVLIAVMGYLQTKGFIGDAERNLIWTIAGGFGIVRTISKFE